jgi:G:T-mismatch repair DNA endonuclease (very short patch repair protein)
VEVLKVKYHIFINDKRLVSVIKQSERKMFLELSDQTRIKRSDIQKIHVVCDHCQGATHLKNLPDKYLLYNDGYLCKVCRNTGVMNPAYGKRWTPEQKEARSKQYTGVNNPMYGKSLFDVWCQKHGTDVANEMMLECAAKHSANNKGENNPMYGKSFHQVWISRYGEESASRKLDDFKSKQRKLLLDNPEKHNTMIINSHKGRYRKTSIERTVEDYLKSQNYNFKYNFILDNKYQFDFLLKDRKIIIEAHGDYWHGNPNKYSEKDPTKIKLNENQTYKIRLDLEKASYVSANTEYQIIYLWETDIKNGYYKEILKRWNL